MVPYLEKAEMDALLAAPDRRIAQGRRDYALLLFLYNSGARATEAAQLKVRDLDIRAACVKITGKGGKQRLCPLWPATVATLEGVMGGRGAGEPVFVNRLGHPITRFGIHTVVERYTLQICAKFPALATKRVSPHSIRHYVASRTISGKFGFGPFFGHISRFTGYIVLTASTTPAWGHEPSTVCRRQANSSTTIAEGLVASAHWPIARNHCVSSGIPSPQPAHPFALLSPGKTMLGNWRELRAT